MEIENTKDPIYDLRFNINYYGADYPVETLVRRMDDGGFIIPNFQRMYVWKVNEASRFIESLLLGLPVPSLFLAKDKFSNRLIVIDGQQRLRTLQYFYSGHYPDGRPFRLKNVASPFEGNTYQDLPPEDKRNLDNTIIHCIVIAENEDSNRIFYLFERLNTTGTPLNSQEIRNALYHGPFNEMLFELGSTKVWEQLYHKDDNRLEPLELILRFFALHYSLDSYVGNMNQFLNDFMLYNRDFSKIQKNQFEELFHRTMQTILEGIGKNAFYHNKSFNRILFETVSVIISNHLDNHNSHEKIKRFYDKLIENDKFWELTKSSTTSKKNLLTRFAFVENLYSEAT